MKRQGWAAMAAAALLAGCANDGTLNTAAITASKTAEPKTAAIDPVCQALANQIAMLRQEGTPERLEKASSGKGETVKVKRDALVKQAELNKANAEFQAKCGPKITPAQTAAVPAPAAPVNATAPAAPAPAAHPSAKPAKVAPAAAAPQAPAPQAAAQPAPQAQPSGSPATAAAGMAAAKAAVQDEPQE